MTMDSKSSIISISKQISDLSLRIASANSAAAGSEPDFSTSSTSIPATPEYELLRASLNDAALDLLRLVNGPRNTLRALSFSHYDLSALQVAVDRGFFSHVPLPGEGAECKSDDGIDASVIAEKAKMDDDRTARLLRLLATHRIFEEVGSGSGRFRHTAMSALMARDEDFHAMVHMQMDDMFKAASELSTLLDQWPDLSDAKNNAFCAKYGVPTYTYYEQNPQKGVRFAQSMNAWSQMSGGIRELHSSFPWAGLKEGKVVDIGGGSGHISIGLAREFPNLRFIVQDLSPNMLSQAQTDAIAGLEGRIEFQQHSFFDPQPVHDANVFLLRQCLHNYNDLDCIRIIRALVPALEKCDAGTSFLINDIILPENGSTTRYVDHHLRQIDLTMMVAFGAKQRSAREFEELLKEADSRFEVVRIFPNAMGAGLLEIHLRTA